MSTHACDPLGRGTIYISPYAMNHADSCVVKVKRQVRLRSPSPAHSFPSPFLGLLSRAVIFLPVLWWTVNYLYVSPTSDRYRLLRRYRTVIALGDRVAMVWTTCPTLLLGVYTFRSSDRPVGPTQATSDSLSDQSDKPVGQTVAEPPSSVNHINVAC